MFKSKLMKAAVLGLCLSAFSSNVAFAQQLSTPASTPMIRSEVLTEGQKALYAKQKEIDQYLFTDHAEDIEDKGFSVYTTGVVGDVIEIGIVPFTKENANYLYKIFGSDKVKVVEGDISIIYSSGMAETSVGAAEPGVVVNSGQSAPDDSSVQPVTVTGAGTDGSPAALPDDAVSFGADPVTADAAVTDIKGALPPANAASSDEEMTIQIESVNEAAASDNNILKDTAVAKSTALPVIDKASNAVPASLIVLAIAGGAVILGGAAVTYNRKRNKK